MVVVPKYERPIRVDLTGLESPAVLALRFHLAKSRLNHWMAAEEFGGSEVR